MLSFEEVLRNYICELTNMLWVVKIDMVDRMGVLF